MTQDMMTLRALWRQRGREDSSLNVLRCRRRALLCEMIGFTAERLMALEVEGLTGASVVVSPAVSCG